jgi:epoxyqueuosine reductase
MRPAHAQRAQQVAHEGGLAGAQVAVQLDEGARSAGCGGQRPQSGGGGLVAPGSTGWGRARVSRIAACRSAGLLRSNRWLRPLPWARRLLQAGRRELGFSQIAVAPVDLHDAEPGLLAWLEAGFHGGMDYMAAHGLKRARPAELVPGTVSVITARMDYLPRATPDGWQAVEWQRLAGPSGPWCRLYARGRDYHKVLRRGCSSWPTGSPRPRSAPSATACFTDSAPVLEVELAARSGLGWRGKHTLAAEPRGRLDVLPGRDLRRPGAAADPPPAAIAALQRLHRGLPDAGHRRALPAGRAALHQLPDHRARRADPEELRPPSATASTAATTASSPAPGTSTRSAARCPTSTSARAWRRSDAAAAVWAGSEAEFLRRTEGSADPPHRLRCAGGATWRWRWATRWADAARLAERMLRFDTQVRTMGKLRKRDTVDLDFLPGRGLVMARNGSARFDPIPGDDLYAALLRCFLGDRPADPEMKTGLLGGPVG